MKEYYNPMSKEFQDERKRLGLTGRQLTDKYRKEGKSVEKDEVYVKYGDRRRTPREKDPYNITNTCDICREEGIETKLYPGIAFREKDKDGNRTGRWLCKKCWRNFDPNSDFNMCRELSDYRTGNLDQNSSVAKGNSFEELTSTWKEVKILSIENDCYNGPLDHSANSEGIVYQTKGRFYNSHHQWWHFNLEREWNKIFDYEICYCMSRDGKTIERIYIFPKEEIIKRTALAIYKHPSPSIGIWTEKYRIKDEKILELVNNIWKKIVGT